MNKHEAIDQLKESLSKMIENIEDENGFNKGYRYATQHCFDIIKQIDEPEKPVVPRFVADYIDSEQYSCSTLSEALDNMDDEKRILDWFYINSETFAKAWLYGYEVEHEQQYVVAIPDDARNGFIQLWKNRDGKLFFNFSDKIRHGEVHLLTEQEIKQKDERLWQFAKEVEND